MKICEARGSAQMGFALYRYEALPRAFLKMSDTQNTTAALRPDLNKNDYLILWMIYHNYSLKEMADRLSIGVSSVQYRVDRLVDGKMVIVPEERKARSRSVSQSGIEEMKRIGLDYTTPPESTGGVGMEKYLKPPE